MSRLVLSPGALRASSCLMSRATLAHAGWLSISHTKAFSTAIREHSNSLPSQVPLPGGRMMIMATSSEIAFHGRDVAKVATYWQR